MRSASDFNTSSNCLPPLAACEKARVIATENAAALIESPSARERTASSAVESSVAELSASPPLRSRKLSAIGIPRHHVGERGAVERRPAAAGGFQRASQFARRHA